MGEKTKAITGHNIKGPPNRKTRGKRSGKKMSNIVSHRGHPLSEPEKLAETQTGRKRERKKVRFEAKRENPTRGHCNWPTGKTQ